jgi:hypothetical protein
MDHLVEVTLPDSLLKLTQEMQRLGRDKIHSWHIPSLFVEQHDM